jgi:hypothetical protein
MKLSGLAFKMDLMASPPKARKSNTHIRTRWISLLICNTALSKAIGDSGDTSKCNCLGCNGGVVLSYSDVVLHESVLFNICTPRVSVSVLHTANDVMNRWCTSELYCAMLSRSNAMSSSRVGAGASCGECSPLTPARPLYVMIY